MAKKEYYTILKTVFDNIFELNFAEKTLRYICSTEDVLFCSAGSIRVYMDDALNTWLNSEVHPEDREMMEELFQSAADAGADNRSLRVQFRMGAGGQSEQNEYAWYFGEIIRLSDELCCFGFNKIEEQKAISILNQEFNEKKKRSEWNEKEETVFSRAGIAVVDYDISERKYRTAKIFERYAFSRLDPDHVDKDALNACIHPEDLEKYTEFADKIRDMCSEYIETEVRVLLTDGGYQWTVIGASLFGIGDTLSKIIFTLQSTDEVNESKTRLFKADKFLKAIVDNDDSAVLAFTRRDGRYEVLYFNKSFCDYFGMPCDKPGREEFGRVDMTALFTAEQLRLLSEEGHFELKNRNSGGKSRVLDAECKTIENIYIVYFSIRNNTESVPPARSGPAVKVITFGYFDVFVNNKPVLFISEKAKELFALLIDRRGGYVSSSEAISMLWEDEPYDEKTQARYRKTAFNLRKTLEEYGIEDILESKNGKRRIDPEKVRCDLYDYLTGDSQFASMFRGMYMLNYSWGEVTLSNLTGGY